MTMDEPLKVQVGRCVEVELVDVHGGVQHLTLNLVPDSQADFAQGFLGESTPLARAIQGAVAGSEVPYPVADIVKVRVLSVGRSTNLPSPDASARREAAIRRAEAEIQRRNAISFASSFSGKWGDYDPDGIEKWEVESPDG